MYHSRLAVSALIDSLSALVDKMSHQGSQGQKLRAANDHSKNKEARGLSSTSSENDVEMMVKQNHPNGESNHQPAEKDQPMEVIVSVDEPSACSPESLVKTSVTDSMDTTTTNESLTTQPPLVEIEESTSLESPDLVKTLKTVKALKKTFRDTFIKGKESVNEQEKQKTNLQNDNVIGNQEEADETGCITTAPSCPLTSSSIPAASRTASSQTTTSMPAVPQSYAPQKQEDSNLEKQQSTTSLLAATKLPETQMASGADNSKESGLNSAQHHHDEEMQSAPTHLIVKEHSDPHQHEKARSDPHQHEKAVLDDADSDKDKSSSSLSFFEKQDSSNATCNVAFKTSASTKTFVASSSKSVAEEEREEEEVIQPKKKVDANVAAAIAEQVKLSNSREAGQVSTCQETNNYSLSPPSSIATKSAPTYTASTATAAKAAATSQSSHPVVAQSLGHSKNASDSERKPLLLDTTQNDLECTVYEHAYIVKIQNFCFRVFFQKFRRS